MDDLISKQAAIDAVSEYGGVWMEYSRGMTKDEIAQRALNSAKATMIRIVKQLPSAQPEIIRCKDCKYWTKQEDSLQGRCALFGIYPTGRWYCANAKKKGDPNE